MKIALCGPASLHLVCGLLDDATNLPEGYRYPLAAYLAKIYHARGHDVSIMSNVHGATAHSKWSGERFEIRLDPRRRVKEFVLDCYKQERKSTLRALDEIAPDIAHGQWVYDYAHAVAESGIPHLVTIRDYPWAIAKHTRSPYRVYRALYSHYVVPKIQNLSAISNYVAEPFNKVYRYKKPIRLIPNGLSRELFADESCTESRRSCRVFVSVSGWDPRKNVKALLRAFGALRRKNPAATLLLMGGSLGPGEAGQQWATAQKLTDGVEFLGHMEHAGMLTILRERGDVFVHSTLEESFCMTVLEAMAQGLPVVAFPDSGAIPWLLDQGEAGQLAASQRWQALADAMEAVYSDADLRARLAAAGYLRAKTHFTLEAVADQYLKAYEDVLAGTYNNEGTANGRSLS
jgi:glycosyltransferase involved in cell wall biosynthesis